MRELAAALFAVFCLAACGPDNVAACRAYVEHHNGLECVDEAEQIDVAAYCPEELNEGGDLRGYYACLADNARCDGDRLDLSGQGSCSLERS